MAGEARSSTHPSHGPRLSLLGSPADAPTGTLECVVASKPIVAIPFFGDQPENANLLVGAGAGEYIGKVPAGGMDMNPYKEGDFTAKTVATAVAKIMANPDYTKAVAKMVSRAVENGTMSPYPPHNARRPNPGQVVTRERRCGGGGAADRVGSPLRHVPAALPAQADQPAERPPPRRRRLCGAGGVQAREEVKCMGRSSGRWGCLRAARECLSKRACFIKAC